MYELRSTSRDNTTSSATHFRYPNGPSTAGGPPACGGLMPSGAAGSARAARAGRGSAGGGCVPASRAGEAAGAGCGGLWGITVLRGEEVAGERSSSVEGVSHSGVSVQHMALWSLQRMHGAWEYVWETWNPGVFIQHIALTGAQDM